METPSELLSQLEIETMFPDIDPNAVNQLVESLLKDLEENDNPQIIKHEHSDPVSGTLAFGKTSPMNSSRDGDPSPSHKVIGWQNWDDENIDLKVLERSIAKTGSSSRSPHYAQEHVAAERKRREKISQQFLALSTLVPEIKKRDKVSLLEGAIDYLKALERKVENLEEEAKSRGQKERQCSALFTHDNDRIYPDKSEANLGCLPKVEASNQGNSMQIRIQCAKRKGALVKVFSEIDKLGLSMINTNVVQFDNSLDMTITTEREEGFSLTPADVVTNLTSAIRRFHG